MGHCCPPKPPGSLCSVTIQVTSNGHVGVWRGPGKIPPHSTGGWDCNPLRRGGRAVRLPFSLGTRSLRRRLRSLGALLGSGLASHLQHLWAMAVSPSSCGHLPPECLARDTSHGFGAPLPDLSRDPQPHDTPKRPFSKQAHGTGSQQGGAGQEEGCLGPGGPCSGGKGTPRVAAVSADTEALWPAGLGAVLAGPAGGGCSPGTQPHPQEAGAGRGAAGPVRPGCGV